MSSFFFTGAGSLLNRLSSSRSELADLFEVVFSVELPQGSEDVVEDADEVAGAEVGGAEKSSNRDSILLICFMPCTQRICQHMRDDETPILTLSYKDFLMFLSITCSMLTISVCRANKSVGSFSTGPLLGGTCQKQQNVTIKTVTRMQ